MCLRQLCAVFLTSRNQSEKRGDAVKNTSFLVTNSASNQRDDHVQCQQCQSQHAKIDESLRSVGSNSESQQKSLSVYKTHQNITFLDHPAQSHENDAYYREVSDATDESARMVMLSNWNPLVCNSIDNKKDNDEHKLIARYTATLASMTGSLTCKGESRHNCVIDLHQDHVHDHRDELLHLEMKNRYIMAEISRLKMVSNYDNMFLVKELGELRVRKDELEDRMLSLHEARRELTGQLDTVMRLLAPTSSVPSAAAAMSSSTTMLKFELNMEQQNSTTLGMHQLLKAADCITNAMNNLVRQLNQESTPLSYDYPHVRRETTPQIRVYKPTYDSRLPLSRTLQNQQDGQHEYSASQQHSFFIQ